MTLLDEALANGQPALTEYAAKRFLAGYGIPVPREAFAPDADAAADAAARLGFPVAVKASGASLQHKTEVGGVALNLQSDEAVRQEGRRLAALPGCDGLLVAEMVRGDRELACGLTRDPQFGPCVMVGLGGVLTEALGDAVFRVAPLTTLDALEMLQEIRAAKLLEPFRGQAPANREVLAAILVALGAIGLRHPAILEIDLNPIKIRPDGDPVAVDALIAIAPPRA
ncbi:MAG: carboxylate--amine ligase [Zetaproteobacteria bacterium]|nr:MAG: carboxylate--amine ligase [Zetaproteobacteria bacterium]